eukprot:16610-Chlamydomonas_euryale.AAC.24
MRVKGTVDVSRGRGTNLLQRSLLWTARPNNAIRLYQRPCLGRSGTVGINRQQGLWESTASRDAGNLPPAGHICLLLASLPAVSWVACHLLLHLIAGLPGWLEAQAALVAGLVNISQQRWDL